MDALKVRDKDFNPIEGAWQAIRDLDNDPEVPQDQFVAQSSLFHMGKAVWPPPAEDRVY